MKLLGVKIELFFIAKRSFQEISVLLIESIPIADIMQ